MEDEEERKKETDKLALCVRWFNTLFFATMVSHTFDVPKANKK
jgi:hypothetical protein